MDDFCLVIHFNGFVFAEKGRGPFVPEMGYTTYPDKKYGSFRYRYHKSKEELPPCDMDRIETFELFDVLSFYENRTLHFTYGGTVYLGIKCSMLW